MLKATRDRHQRKYILENEADFIQVFSFPQIGKIFMKFQIRVYKSVKENGWDGADSTEDGDQQWSFAGSLLFAVTVITTIGKQVCS